MSNLITPFSKHKIWYHDDGTEFVQIHDANSMHVCDLFSQDADEIVKRINEHEQLKTRVARLEESFIGVIKIADRKTDAFDKAKNVLNETPRQSLSEIKADAIDEAASHVGNGMWCKELAEYAEQLRNDKGE